MEAENINIEEISHEKDEDHQSIEQNTCKQNENGGEVLENGNKANEEEEEEVGEKCVAIESSKKPKQTLKPNPKTKVTVPKPFSLATDQRKIARETQASVDLLKDTKPTFTRSKSLISHKELTQLSNGGERSSVLSRSRSVRSTSQASLPPKITARKPVDTIAENGNKATAQGNVTKKNKLKLDSKVGGDAETKKPTKTNTFKALSLPSFYHKKDPLPTPETKKITVKDSKSVLPEKERKSVSITGDKGRVSRNVTSNAKETITKLLKTTQKSRSKPVEIMKVAVVPNA